MVDQETLQKLKTSYKKLTNATNCESLLKKYLTKEVYKKLRNRKTTMGATLQDVIQSGVSNLDSSIGIYAPDSDSYSVFAELFNPVIEHYHAGFTPTDRHPPSDFGDMDAFENVDPTGEYVLSTRICCARSLQGYPFNPCLTEENYKEIEDKVSAVLISEKQKFKGSYYPLRGMDEATLKKLTGDQLLFKEGDRFRESANSCRFWPTGRGIFHNDKKTFFVWVNEEDHIRIFSVQMGGDIRAVLKRLVVGLKKIESLLPFSRDDRLGYLTSCPTNIGTTIRASVLICLPKMSKNIVALQKVATEFSLQVQAIRDEQAQKRDGVYEISSKSSLGLTEYQAVKEMQRGILEIIKLEKLAVE